MEIIIKIAQFVLSFSLLVIVHELGHFLFARMSGMRVEKFYLFFDWGFSLLRFTYKGTEYGIGWVPFGGYVKIAGMVDESMDTEQMAAPPSPDEFRSRPAWQRLPVMAGGVLMNVVLAICIYIGMTFKWGDVYLANEDAKYGYVFSDPGREMGFEDGDRIVSVAGVPVGGDYTRIFMDMILGQASEVVVERGGEHVTVDIGEGYLPGLLNSKVPFMEPRIPFIVGKVPGGSAAEKAGLRSGDRIMAINGAPMSCLDVIVPALAANKGEVIDLAYERDSAGVTLLNTTAIMVGEDGMMRVYHLGPAELLHISTREYTFRQSIPEGVRRAGAEIAGYWKQIKLILTPGTEAYKSVSGPVGIANIFPGYWSWMAFWRITALLSIALAVMNILPIPALDGGHVLLILCEAVTGRKPGDGFMMTVQTIGMILLFGLLIVITGNDIYKLLAG